MNSSDNHDISPNSLFHHLVWDGVTNPFKNRADQGASTDLTTLDKAAADLFRQFEKSFNEAFLSSSPLPVADTRPAEKMISKAQIIEEAWLKRIDRLKRHCTEPVSPLWAPWTFKRLVDAYPWRRSSDPVFVYIHEAFCRPFTALGPESFLFLAPMHLKGNDPLLSSVVIHELAHIDDARTKGWLTFQQCDASRIELNAMTVEAQHLRTLVAHVGGSWSSSRLRIDWNESYAKFWIAALRDSRSVLTEKSLKDASLYLTVMDCVDPL